MNNEELIHYGVPGMKWGVIRWKDNRTRRSLKRQLAADKNNLKFKGKMSNEATADYSKAYKKYEKALSRPSLSSKKKMKRVDAALEGLEIAGKNKEKAKKELLRADRIYESDEKRYREHVDKMMNKYGSENVKSISTKTINVGKYYCKEVVRTGITVADLPLIGTMYSGKSIASKDYKDRQNLIDDAAKKRY